MDPGKRRFESSLTSKIMVSFFLVILAVGISITWILRGVLQSSLMARGVEESLAIGVVSSFIINSVSISTLAIVVALLIAYFLSRSISRPIVELRESAEEIRRGNLDVEIEVQSRDELGELADTFSRMIAEIRENRENLLKHKTELEKAVAERTAQLAVKMEELALSNKELEQFAYVASHDLQEPLRMVSSYVQLLARRYKGKLDPDADEFIDYAVAGALRMRKLINALLMLSRVDMRGQPFEPSDFTNVVKRSITNLKMAIDESAAEISCAQLPTVMANADQMTQLFQNLIGNAIKFRGDEPPRIRIAAERKDGEWVFSVKDNGIGIAQEHFERIFNIFQHLHGKGEYEGTGIGLAVCKKIVEMHRGRIWVESTPGGGSTFYLTIPAEAGGNGNEV